MNKLDSLIQVMLDRAQACEHEDRLDLGPEGTALRNGVAELERLRALVIGGDEASWAMLKHAGAECDKLREENKRLRSAQRILWMVIASNGGYTLEHHEIDNYPGDDKAIVEQVKDEATRTVELRANVAIWPQNQKAPP